MEHSAETQKVRPRPVLVVEDDDDVREAIAGLLVDDMYLPLCANSGADALRLLHREELAPGLIILDLMMPEMNGPAFATAIRQDARWCDVPILVVSADRQIHDVSKTIGATAVLPKPFDIEKFHELVNMTFRKVARLEEPPVMAASPRAPADVSPAVPRKALLIDDSEVSLRDTRATLVSAGMEVVATLGLVGVGAALSREGPDIVVIGSSMPVVFHKRLVALLRERGATCVMLSGDGSEDALAHCVADAGADGYVPTRASPARVASNISVAFSHRRRR